MAEQSAGEALSLTEIARKAKEQLSEVTGMAPETISGIRYDDDYWYVNVETLELSRIPPTTDIMSSFLVQLDGDGDLVEYRRTRRYFRNQIQEENS